MTIRTLAQNSQVPRLFPTAETRHASQRLRAILAAVGCLDDAIDFLQEAGAVASTPDESQALDELTHKLGAQLSGLIAVVGGASA